MPKTKKYYKRPDEKKHISITEKTYNNLINGLKNDTLSDYQKKKIKEILNVKYCECVEDIAKQKYDTEYNPYAVCNTSVYTNRGLEIPPAANYSCREKYRWFREPRK